MGTNRFNIDHWNKKSSFKVPEGYMEGLTEQIMKQLPERSSHEEEKVVSFSDKIRPWLYLAASFVGLILLFKGISLMKGEKEHEAAPLYVQTETPEPSLTAIYEEDHEFLEYLEMQYADNLFLEEIEDIE